MTKNILVLTGTGLVSILAATTPVLADTATSDATAEIHRPIEVSAGDDLDFGKFVANTTTTGFVTIEPENIRSECSVAFCGGSFSPSSFDVSGQPGQVVDITHAGTSMNPITFSMTDGTNTITFGLILHTPTLTLDAAGEGSFNIGARVRVPANTPEGNYAGSYNVQIDYQ